MIKNMSLKRSNSDVKEKSSKKVKPEITQDYLDLKFEQYLPQFKQWDNRKIYTMWAQDLQFGISGVSIEEIDKFIQIVGIDVPEEIIVKVPYYPIFH